MSFEFSAGGIIYKKEQDQIWILLCQHSQHHGWVFPKGLIGDNIKDESKEATALREVKEETGAKARIIRPLPPVTYWYIWEGALPAKKPQHEPCTNSTEKANAKVRREKIKKTVYYFLMEYIGGDITQHDTEMEAVEWLPIDKVEDRLSYKADKKVWQQAKNNLKF